MGTIKNYLSLIKFSHTIFAMPFAMIGFVLALSTKKVMDGQWNLPREIGSGKGDIIYKSELLVTFLLVVSCMILARSAAMAFNRYLDRSFDARNIRTAIREIPSGILKADRVLWFTVICSLLFVGCTFFINRVCFFLSPIALGVVLGYSYTKRFTPFCHLILGLGLSLAPIGAYLAITGRFNLLPILFSLSVVCWVSGFDIIYALQDEEFDKSENLFSIPVSMGKSRALRISELLHIFSVIFILAAGLYGSFHVLYWVGVLLFAGMLVYQHSVVKPDDLRRVNLAFMTANGIASVLFAVFVIADLLIIRNS